MQVLASPMVTRPVRAGLGPEDVFLVVNSASPASKAVANHYQQLRSIPANNMMYLDWSGPVTVTDIDTFRDRILQPIFIELEKRNLISQIDCIAYSSDFPYGVEFSADTNGDAKHTTASLTGMTFLAQQTMTGNPNIYTNLDSNWYARPKAGRGRRDQSHGFRSSYYWRDDGGPHRSSGRRYILATMLAYTSGRGNSLREVVSYLRRSALADGTHPDGTIYLMKSNDVRSRTRQGGFPNLINDLRELGIRAEVANGQLPQGKSDVAGAVVGTSAFKWENSGSTILPGAIVENLTSYGGILKHGAGQTPMTAFLRHGAAGSSGTVIEPFAIQAKFPHPDIHLHYARGCTLAESFYQSVRGPYQLLVVGDPLCRPWASIPVVEVEGVEANQSISGVIEIRPKTRSKTDTPVAEFALLIDGRELVRVADGSAMRLDTRKIPDGRHEIRIVAIEDSLIESHGQIIVPVNIDNHQRKITCRVSKQKVPWNQYLFFAAESPGSESIVIIQNRRPIAKIAGEKGQVRIDPRSLGVGPVQLQAIGISSQADKMTNVFSNPIDLLVVSPYGMPELPKPISGRRVSRSSP